MAEAGTVRAAVRAVVLVQLAAGIRHGAGQLRDQSAWRTACRTARLRDKRMGSAENFRAPDRSGPRPLEHLRHGRLASGRARGPDHRPTPRVGHLLSDGRAVGPLEGSGRRVPHHVPVRCSG